MSGGLQPSDLRWSPVPAGPYKASEKKPRGVSSPCIGDAGLTSVTVPRNNADMNELLSWAMCGGSLLGFFVYEAWVVQRGRRHPERMARYAHARMRVAWVASMKAQPGSEIVAVQALRNSLMSATIAASTAALALMGTVTLAGSQVASSIALLGPTGSLSPRILLEGLLIITLFASYVCSATAMRYFNHAGFAMSMPVGSAERAQWLPLASAQVERAGLLYSWGLRSFLMVTPLVAGIVNPWLMPPVTLLLMGVLWAFDAPALPRDSALRTRAGDA